MIIYEMSYKKHLKNVEKEARQEGRQAGIEEGRQVGLEEGRQAGIEEGKQVGLEEGLQAGRQAGRQESKLEVLNTAIDAYKKGDINLEVATAFTKLKQEEFLKLVS